MWALSLAFAACREEPKRPPADGRAEAPAPAATTPAPGGALAEIASAMDRSVGPCDDFYRYACGGWLATHEIPEDKPFTSRFALLDDRTHVVLHEVLVEAAERPGNDPRRKQIGDFFAACMDQAAIDAAGTTPLRPALDEIARVVDRQSALEVAARLRMFGVEAFLFIELEPDYAAPTTEQPTIRQGGLGLPSRELYLQDDQPSRVTLEGYTRHVAAMLALVGEPGEDVATTAQEVVALETALARASLPLESLREVEQTYHPMSVAALGILTPGIDWPAVFAAAGNGGVARVNVATPEFFRIVGEQLGRTRPSQLRAYLRWQLLRASAEHLAAPIEAQSFAWTATLTGQRALAPRWRRCVDRTVAALPEAVGPVYVEVAFTGDSKPVALAMIVAIEQTFERGLADVAWMDEPTRAQARAKISAIRNKIGFPDRWRDHAAVRVDRRDYFGSLYSARAHELARQMQKAGRPVDPDEWHNPASVLNAYANPLGPEMVFPAAIMQPPLFSTDLPAAVNFGAIGAIMGHELTHHFDDQGRKFAANGALVSWWSDTSQRGFAAAASCVVRQYDGYTLGPKLQVNGQQTLGENIADLGGLKYAHAAYLQWAAQHPEPEPLPGLDAEQLFFVAYAQNYCSKQTPELERIHLLGDVHAPWRFRAVGPLVNSPAFAAAFACAEGTAMRPSEVCSVW